MKTNANQDQQSRAAASESSQSEVEQLKGKQTLSPPSLSFNGENPPANNNPNNTPIQRKLPEEVQGHMESSFGTSFADVNIHTDSQEATNVNALAFTQGNNIHFAPGQFKPNTSAGKELIGHELTHVVQQRAGKVQPTTSVNGKAVNDDTGLEAEADQMGRQVAQAKAAPSTNPVAPFQLQNPQGGVIQNKVIQRWNPFGGIIDSVRSGADAIAKQMFLAKNQYGPQDLAPPTQIGGFSAMYHPRSGPDGSLLVYVSTAVNFQDGLSIDGSGNVTDNTGELSDAVSDIMGEPVANRAAQVARFQWTAQEKIDHLEHFKDRCDEAEDAWSTSSHGQRFFIDKENWQDIEAGVSVVILVNDTPTGIEHLTTTVNKVPTSGGYSAGAWVSSGSATDARDSGMTIDSNNNTKNETSTFLRETVYFRDGSARLTASARNQLRNFVMLYQDSANNTITNKLKLVGRASSSGEEASNSILAQKRIDAVENALKTSVTGPESGANFPALADARIETDNQGETGAGEGEEWRRVDIIIGSGEVQNTVIHEFGHVFGLDDEYVTDPSESVLDGGTGGVTGTRTGHDSTSHAEFANSGGDNSVYEMNDSIMSVGNEVRSNHMVTFNWALRELTGKSEWKIKS